MIRESLSTVCEPSKKIGKPEMEKSQV